MFYVVFGWDKMKKVVSRPAALRTAFTLQEALNMREVTGDLVFDAATMKIVTEKDWLWNWEKQNPQCYAQKRISDNVSLELLT